MMMIDVMAFIIAVTMEMVADSPSGYFRETRCSWLSMVWQLFCSSSRNLKARSTSTGRATWGCNIRSLAWSVPMVVKSCQTSGVWFFSPIFSEQHGLSCGKLLMPSMSMFVSKKKNFTKFEFIPLIFGFVRVICAASVGKETTLACAYFDGGTDGAMTFSQFNTWILCSIVGCWRI